MFAKKLSDAEYQAAKIWSDATGGPSYRLLKAGGYRIFMNYDVTRKSMVYGAVAKDSAAAAKLFAVDKMAVSLSEGRDPEANWDLPSAPLLCYLYEKEKNLSEEQMASLYGDVYTKIKDSEGLSPKEARIKLEMRDDFQTFLNKLVKEEQKKKADTLTDKMSAVIGIDLASAAAAKISVNVISKRKEHEVKDMYKFLTGFKTRDTYGFPGKEAVVLDGSSFVSPYSSALPLLASLAHFQNKSRTNTLSISYERLSPVLDILRSERIRINGVLGSVCEDAPVAISMGDDGKPIFDPPFDLKGVQSIIGTEGIYIYRFDEKEKNPIRFRPFQSPTIGAAYKYFKYADLDRFAYIRDLFMSELLPKIATSVKVRSGTKARPFQIALYLSFDSQDRLRFKTVYQENGNEVEREKIEGDYGRSIASAYLSVLKSLSGVENGTLSGASAHAFLTHDLSSLTGLCDLYCEDRLKPGNIQRVSGLRVNVQKNGGYLDLTLDHDRYSEEELSGILLAYEQKKKYFLLKDRTILLDGPELDEAENIFRNGAVHLDDAPIYHLFALENGKMKVRASAEAREVLTAVKDFTKTAYTPGVHFKGELKRYQTDGVKYLKTIAENGLGAILADEMGLGKTVQAIAYLTSLKGQGTALVICPKAVLYNWESEIRRFSDLPALVVDGNRDRRLELIASLTRKHENRLIVITSYDSFRRDASAYEMISFRNAFLDEAQSVKNAFSQRHQALAKLKAVHRFALTGTPLENSQTDIWSIFDFLMPGYLRSLKEFADMIGEEQADKRIASLAKPFILRRLKKDVIKDLPELTETNIVIPMDESQRILYLATLQKIRDEKDDNRIAVLAGLTRLRQLCVDPSAVMENYEELTTKLTYCRDLIDECRANGHKAIVFSSFKTVLHHFEEILDGDDIPYGIITGDTPAKERLKLAESFNTESELSVMLVSLKAGGVGLNLIGADTVILLDPWWNPAAEAQASGRAHRIGQQNSVTVYRLIAKDSIEEKVQTLQQMKKDLFDTIVEGTGGAGRLSDDDIAFLLG